MNNETEHLLDSLNKPVKEIAEAIQKNKLTDISDSVAQLLLQEEMTTTGIYILLIFLCYKLIVWILGKIDTLRQGKRKSRSIEEIREGGKRQEYNEFVKVSRLRVREIVLRNTFLILAIVGIFIIWKEPIKSAFFSVSFAIMGFVVLFRDVLINVLASLVITTTKSFELLDIVEVKGRKGTIVDRSFFNVTISLEDNELGVSTGEHLKIPNAHFLSSDVILLGRYGYRTVKIEISLNEEDRKEVSECIEDMNRAIEKVTRSGKEKFERLREKWEKEKKTDIYTYDYFTSLDFSHKDPKLIAKITVEAIHSASIERAILLRYLEARVKSQEDKRKKRNQEKGAKKAFILDGREVAEEFLKIKKGTALTIKNH